MARRTHRIIICVNDKECAELASSRSAKKIEPLVAYIKSIFTPLNINAALELIEDIFGVKPDEVHKVKASYIVEYDNGKMKIDEIEMTIDDPNIINAMAREIVKM